MGGVQISIGGRLEKIQKITGGKEWERGGGGGEGGGGGGGGGGEVSLALKSTVWYQGMSLPIKKVLNVLALK